MEESLLLYRRKAGYALVRWLKCNHNSAMEVQTDSTGSGQILPDGESLSDYVKRKETDQNLKKLAEMLKSDLSQPGADEPDLPFEKFEKKIRENSDQ